MTTKYEILPEEKLVKWYEDDELMSTFHIETLHHKIERPIIITGDGVQGAGTVSLTIFLDGCNKICNTI